MYDASFHHLAVKCDSGSY